MPSAPAPNLMQTFGSRLRFLRTIKNLTQADLAEQLGVSVKHIGRVERGEASPSFALIQSLANVLETPALGFFLHLGHATSCPDPDCGPPDARSSTPLCKRLCFAHELGTWALENANQSSSWSSSLYIMLGHAPFSVKPSTSFFLKHVVPLQQPAAAEFLAAVTQSGQHCQPLLVDIESKTGQHRKLTLKPETSRTAHDQRPFTQLIVQDISECAALNQAMALHQEKLENYVLARHQDLAMALDTVRQEAEQRAKAEQGLRVYEQMVNHAHDAQGFIDAEGKIIAVNKEYERLSGMAAQDVVGNKWTDYLIAYHGQEAFETTFKARVEEALYQRKECSIQEWRTYKNGIRRFVHVIYTPCTDNEHLLGVVVTVHDLTDFMKMHERLGHQERMYRQMLETAGEAIVILDTSLRITYINPKTTSLLGYDEDEFLGASAIQFVHPADIDHIHQQLADTLAGDLSRFPARLVDKNGRVVWTQTTTTVMRDSHDIPEGILVMLTDITELKTTETALRQREQLLELATEATMGLLRDSTNHQVITDILARMGLILAADRVYIFKNHHMEQTGELLTTRIFEWVASGISPQINNPALQNLSLASTLPRWLREMTAGRCIKGLIETFPEVEQNLFASQDILSLLVVPIRIDGRLWGFLGLDAVQTQREWTASEENILRIVATALGTAITRTEAEETISTQYELLESLFESIPLGVVIWDKQGNLVRSNQKFHELTGYPPDEIRCLEDWFPRVYPDEEYRLQVLANWQASLGQSGTIIRDYPITCRDGSTKNIEFRAQFMKDGRSVVTMVDITQRLKAERALTKSRKEFQAVAEKCPISIIRFDPQGLVTFINEWHGKHFVENGLTRDSLLGRPVHELPGLRSARLSARLHSVLQGSAFTAHDVFFQDFQHGRPGWAVVRGVPIHEDGELDGGILILEDVTWRKLLEREIRHTLRERDDALAEKNTFFSIVAHDLKSPMSGLLTLAQMVHKNLDAYSPKKLRECIGILDTTIQNIYALLENLLSWAQMQRGLTKYEPSPCAVYDVVEQTLALFQATADQKNITLRNNVEPHIQVCADQSMLDTIMRNLVSNALKFTEQGEVVVSASEANPAVEISVQDTGIGMKPNLMNSIFSPFQKTNRPGTA
ncbi:MAG: PAS domain S-box protein [Desulfovibrionales bacterium]|nr:MAG: PAS domain S-box protein [Desulfovibrionales bacterium]